MTQRPGRTRRAFWPTAAVLSGASVIAGLGLYRRNQDDLDRARERLELYANQVVQTTCGPIEYATVGDGTQVLEVHGIFGGFDQGIVVARQVLSEGFRIIAPSRFGYLRTPLPADASPASQTDAYACLLDYLGIDRVTVMAHSAGSPSAIELALRHPERVAALVLIALSGAVPHHEYVPPWNRRRLRHSEGVATGDRQREQQHRRRSHHLRREHHRRPGLCVLHRDHLHDPLRERDHGRRRGVVREGAVR
jgi:pimeloyl-ACP methyl ester carboxylesterase